MNVATPPSTSVRTVVRRSASRKRRSRNPPGGEGCDWEAAAVMGGPYPRARTRPLGPGSESGAARPPVRQAAAGRGRRLRARAVQHAGGAARGPHGRHVRRPARAPAGADPRPSRPGRPRRDRGHADRRQRPRAELRRAGPAHSRRVRGLHLGQHGLPRAVRLPVRDLRARARQGFDPRLRRGAPAERPRERDRRRPRGDRQDRRAAVRGPVKITYGKLRVPLQRVVARDARHELLAAEVSVEVLGENFLAAYTEGDNREVVATDTMKNFILRESLAYEGDTLDGLLEHLGRGFLGTYPVMQEVRMSGREAPFERLSGRLFARPGPHHPTPLGGAHG